MTVNKVFLLFLVLLLLSEIATYNAWLKIIKKFTRTNPPKSEKLTILLPIKIIL